MYKLSIIACAFLCFARSENTDKATLVLYRGREFLGIASEIRINGKLVANLSPNSYLEIYPSPGKVSIESNMYRGSKRVLVVQTEPAQVYYIQAYEEVDFWDRYLIMQVVDTETAKKEMKKCRKNEKVKQPD
jgi:hypothetical protein